MKRQLLYTFLLWLIGKGIMAQQVKFAYDGAGNQIERKYICINCTPTILASPQAGKMVDLKALKNAGAAPTEISGGQRKVSAYPNPVSETLHVKWEITEQQVKLASLEVISVSGQKVFAKQLSPSLTEEAISFSSLPPGTYILRVMYTDKKTETIKIIKI